MTVKMTKNQTGSSLVIALEGRLDTNTAPELEEEFRQSLNGVEDLTLNFANLDYVSSAGLRALLGADRVMSAKGGMKIIHANELVKEVFEVTGLSAILNVE